MMSETGGTHHTDSARVPGPEIQRLGALVGRWRSEGHIVGEVPVPITGTDIYQWLPGGFFLVHHVDVVIGEQTVQALELIGEYDPASGSFTARSYDNQGSITITRTRVDEHGVWTFTGGGERRRGGPARLCRRERSRAVHADGESRPKQHDGQVGALRRRCQLAAVDGPDLHPDAVAPGCAAMLGAPFRAQPAPAAPASSGWPGSFPATHDHNRHPSSNPRRSDA